MRISDWSSDVCSSDLDDPAYIAALAQSVESGIAALDFKPELIIASFHGMPARTRALGDPYYCQCRKTTRLLAERLERDVRISFQSRFGRAKRSEEHTSELQSLMRISYAVFCLKKKKKNTTTTNNNY